MNDRRSALTCPCGPAGSSTSMGTTSTPDRRRFAPPAPTPGLSRQLPVEPVAERAPHDQLFVLRRQPRQLLGEHRDALLPRARHPSNVGPPEHALRAEGVVELPDVSVDVAIRIRLARIARRA